MLSTAACKTEEEASGTFKIVSGNFFDPDIPVTTLHLSCSSDVYQQGHDYAGFVLYSHDGMTDWRLNGIHCKTGYIVVRDTNSCSVAHIILFGNSQGQVHGAVYKSVFGEEVSDDTIGEGFAVRGGKFQWNSGVFNARNTVYHDGRRIASDQAKHSVAKVLAQWMDAGTRQQSLPYERTFYLPI